MGIFPNTAIMFFLPFLSHLVPFLLIKRTDPTIDFLIDHQMNYFIRNTPFPDPFIYLYPPLTDFASVNNQVFRDIPGLCTFMVFFYFLCHFDCIIDNTCFTFIISHKSLLDLVLFMVPSYNMMLRTGFGTKKMADTDSFD